MAMRTSTFQWLCVCGSGLIALTGCATGKVRFDGPASQRDMSRYNSVAVRVINDVGDKCPEGVAENLQAATIRQLKTEHAGVFADVRPVPTGQEDELLTDVHITKYKKGSRFARYMLIGLGPSQILTDVHLKDSASGALLRSGKLDLLWAIGGTVGASKGIEDLVDSSGKKIASAIAESRVGKGGT